jgi:hypothetical protein
MNPKSTIVTLIVFLFFFSKNSQSQINHYFENNPVWQISSMCAVGLPCIKNEVHNYYTDGDTTLNSLVYKKIYRKGQGYYSWNSTPPAGCSGSFYYIDTVPSCFLRSADKKIYFRQPNDTSEYLLYDFNLEVGDTLPLTFNNYESEITVAEIDSIDTPFGFLKRFKLAGNTWAEYLIEGIGHSKGLIEPLNVPLECGYELVCFSLNDAAYYPSNGPTCNINVGITKFDNDISHALFPNPFSDYTTVQFSSTIKNADLNIYNYSGQKIRTIHIVSGENVKIYRENLSTGLYFYEVIQNNTQATTGKFIIIDRNY